MVVGLGREQMWQAAVALGAGWGMVLLPSSLAFAQNAVVPDNTLGVEGSTVREVDALTQFVEGGATRGGNLFHSFLEFNVTEGHSVYFNPDSAIENVLSRVTGESASNIFGRLGMFGDASLWLMNPNGIVFGEDASLDISGSFYATTAEAIVLGNSVFSATLPQSNQLLAISPNVSLANHLTDNLGDITSKAQLQTGENLILSGHNLDLQGQLLAGQNLSLLARNSVQIRDMSEKEFLASAGNSMRIQGNDSIDIFTLNHSNSGFLSGGDMFIISNNPIVGDAHYFSDGSFNAINTNSEAQILLSPNDPIIATSSNVRLGGYEGASLHILAGGRVLIEGNIVITGKEENSAAIGPNSTAIAPGDENRIEFNDPQITVVPLSTSLSGGRASIMVDGNSQPTLDIRSGIDWSILRGGSPEENVNLLLTSNPNPTFISQLTNADIEIVGSIKILAPQGLVLLTNQYSMGSQKLPGNIILKSPTLGDEIDIPESPGIGNGGFRVVGSGGEIILDSRESIIASDENLTDPEMFNIVVRTSSSSGGSGDITLLADQDIELFGVNLISTLEGEGESGNIFLKSGNSIKLNGTDLRAGTGSGAVGNGGNITLEADEIIVVDTFLQSPSNSREDPLSTSGNISLNAKKSIFIEGEAIENLSSFGPLAFLSGGEISTSTFTNGNAGSIIFNAVDGEIKISNSIISSASFQAPFSSGASEVNSGNSGKIEIFAKKLKIENNSSITTGSILTFGGAGDVFISTDNFEIDSSSISTLSTIGSEFPGNIEIVVSQDFQARGTPLGTGGTLSTISLGGPAGNIDLFARDIRLFDDNDISTFVTSSDDLTVPIEFPSGGNINIESESTIAFDDSDILAFSQDGKGGNISLNTVFFGENFVEGASPPFDGNGRVDVNASGIIDGDISFSDVSFIEDSLTELPENPINTDAVIATSCIARGGQAEGRFTIPGAGGLPQTPEDSIASNYSTGDVQTLPTKVSETSQPAWQPGDPIIEPQGIAQLADGRIAFLKSCLNH